ncbi:MAG: hypothetical protein ACPLPV_06345 [Methanomassiliicoccales archaeon]
MFEISALRFSVVHEGPSFDGSLDLARSLVSLTSIGSSSRRNLAKPIDKY